MSAEPSTAASGAFERLLEERYSCRALLPRQVDSATITRMLQIAPRTPSWCNLQPWQVVITRGAAIDRFRDAICAYAAAHEREPDFAFPPEYRGVDLERRRECSIQLYRSVGIARIRNSCARISVCRRTTASCAACHSVTRMPPIR